MKEIVAGSTNQTVDVFIQDSAATDGSGLTGLVYNSAGLTCYYRKGATGSWTQLALATQTIAGAHSDGGFVEGDATNAPGMYRLDFSDTMVAAAGLLKVMLKGAANMAPVVLEIEVVAVNKYDGVRNGLTALPNAAADAAGGLVVSDAGGLDIDTLASNVVAILADTGELQTDWANGGRLDLLIDAILEDTGTTIPATLGTPVGADLSADIAGVPAALLDLSNGVETGLTPRQALRLMASVLYGKVSGGGTGTNTFRDINDSKNRVVSTVDASGNRSAVVLDAT